MGKNTRVLIHIDSDRGFSYQDWIRSEKGNWNPWIILVPVKGGRDYIAP